MPGDLIKGDQAPHEEPSRARSDAANALRLDLLEPLMRRLAALDKIVRHA